MSSTSFEDALVDAVEGEGVSDHNLLEIDHFQVIQETDETKTVDVVTVETDSAGEMSGKTAGEMDGGTAEPSSEETDMDEKMTVDVLEVNGDLRRRRKSLMEEEEEDVTDQPLGLRLNERTILKLQEAFSLFDHDFDGRLSLHQTATMIRAVGLGLTERNIAEILAEAPTAKIDFGTFLTSMADHLRDIRENRAEEEAIAIREAFELLQTTGSLLRCGDEANPVVDGGGKKALTGCEKMTRRRLTRLLTRCGEKLTKHEIDELLDDVGLGETSMDEEILCESLVEKIFEDY